MASTNYIGQRLSFDSAICTVRYVGTVTGTQKGWLGVEWDDPTRGKHDGEHQDVRYFSCGLIHWNTSIKANARVRQADVAQSFVGAVHSKYATETTERRDALASDLETEIIISGKVAQEVGFEKIRVQMAQLHELKIVLVDGLRINKAGAAAESACEVCPRIVELDLSRNLFESCREVVQICKGLVYLKSLSLNGNRFQVLNEELRSSDANSAFSKILDLSLDEMLLPWADICVLIKYFTSLTTLSAASNDWAYISAYPLFGDNMKGLTSLSLEYNSFLSLSSISPLKELPSLQRLHLKGNKINAVAQGMDPKPLFGSQLHYVDLSYNAVESWSFVDDLQDVFPGLTSLRLSHNPIYSVERKTGSASISVDEIYMLTLSRLANLTSLNFSNITTADRTNAEMFYLSRIGKSMAEVPMGDEHIITSQHRRYTELCMLYGEPTVVRVGEAIDPNFLEARLIKCTFYITQNMQSQYTGIVTSEKEVPKGFDTYQLKGIVGRLFGLRPMKLRLVWETGEWDPVAGYEDEEESSGDDEQREEKSVQSAAANKGKGRWMRREVELEDSTKQVGFCIEGLDARIRVELK